MCSTRVCIPGGSWDLAVKNTYCAMLFGFRLPIPADHSSYHCLPLNIYILTLTHTLQFSGEPLRVLPNQFEINLRTAHRI